GWPCHHQAAELAPSLFSRNSRISPSLTRRLRGLMRMILGPVPSLLRRSSVLTLQLSIDAASSGRTVRRSSMVISLVSRGSRLPIYIHSLPLCQPCQTRGQIQHVGLLSISPNHISNRCRNTLRNLNKISFFSVHLAQVLF